jgi:hypothetical protein
MCGRYVRRGDKQKLAEHFRARQNPPELPMPDADYNVAPTTHQPIIRQSRETGDRELVLARWGLVPFFTKDLKDIKGLSTINARSETITTAPTWREPFKKPLIAGQGSGPPGVFLSSSPSISATPTRERPTAAPPICFSAGVKIVGSPSYATSSRFMSQDTSNRCRGNAPPPPSSSISPAFACSSTGW